MNYKFSGRSDEDIKKAMIEEIDTSVLTFAGTFINDLLSPVSIELAQSHIDLWVLQRKMYAENLEGEELDKRVKEWANIERKKATKASGYVNIIGEKGLNIPAGEIVSSENTNYVILEDIVLTDGFAKAYVECLEYGAIGNALPRTIINTNIAGIQQIYNEEAFMNGYETETDEDLYSRYLLALHNPGTSGNKYHYEQWAKEVEGVGDVKVQPLWQGPGTVRVIISDRNRDVASEELIYQVYNHIENSRPIGATLTVVSGSPRNIPIRAKVKLADRHNIRTVKDLFLQELENYRQNTTFKESYISYAKIGNILLSTNGILDYEDLKIAGEMKNIPLEYEDIPIFTDVGLEVI